MTFFSIKFLSAFIPPAGYFLGIFLRGGILACEPVVGGFLGVYYLLENITHYYYCPFEGGEDSSQGGEDSPLPPPSSPPPLENTLRSSFHQYFEETKGYSPGFFFSGSEKMC